MDTEEDKCTCNCPECSDGNCDDCSHDGCDCPGCTCEQEPVEGTLA